MISATNHQDLTYDYDEVGNVKSITDALWTGSRSFTYDDLNRMIQGVGTFGTNQTLVTHDYSYDAVGNILSKAGISYCYGYMANCSDSAHPLAVKSTSDGASYTYDANGNTLGGGGRTYTWTADNRMDVVNGPGGSAVMSYDYTGIRVKKNGTYFPFTGYEVTSGVVTKYIRIGNEIIAAKRAGEKLFYHNDHLGSINVITNIYATKIQLTEYDPWGKISRSEGSTDVTHAFTGQELDPESGIQYYGGRYYNQLIGRFISPDPFVQDPDDPQNLNRYSYVLNGPQNYIDPSGYDWEDYGSYGDVGDTYTFNEIYLVNEATGFAPPTSNFNVQSMMNSYNHVAAFQQSQSWGSWSFSSGGSGDLPSLGSLVQTGLDFGGYVPGFIGTAATLGSAAVSFYQGDYLTGGIGVLAAATTVIGVPSKLTKGILETAGRGLLPHVLGNMGEQALQKLVGGGAPKFFRTSSGAARFVDVFFDGIAHESKVGYQGLSKSLQAQISKDFELKLSGQIEESVWHFWPSPITGRIGPSPALRNALEAKGIRIEIHQLP